jgi:hypothetical protein
MLDCSVMSTPSTKPAIPTRSIVLGQVLSLRSEELAANGASKGITKDVAEQLIADARAGRLVEIYMEACTFVQVGDEPNRNLVRFTNSCLQKMARTFVGMPFLKNHDQGDTASRAGTVVSSMIEVDGDARKIHMTLKITAPWAIEDALRGLVDKFSIGWDPTGPVQCSICGCPMPYYWCTNDKTEHCVGDTYNDKVCQWEFTAADGVEVSTVNVPAVVGTDVDGIRAQLSAARNERLAGSPRKEITMKNLPHFLTLLGLTATSTEDDAFTAAEGVVTRLAAEKEAHSATLALLNETRAKLAKIEGESLSVQVEAEIDRGVREGRFGLKRDAAGARTESAVERSIRHAGKVGGLAAAKEVVDGFPVGTIPVALPSLAATKDLVEKDATDLTSVELKMAETMGIDPKAFLAQKNERR